MQKICGGILVAVFAITVLINLAATPTSYYYAAEYNFDYRITFVKYIFENFKSLPPNSTMRLECDKTKYCKEALNQYIFNGTLPPDTPGEE